MVNDNRMESILKWSLSQSDGSRPSREISEEEKRWFAEALQAHTIDIVKRMKEITIVMNMSEEQLESQGVTVKELEGMLEELQDHVESIDMANDLNSIGGLMPLLNFLTSSHPSLRARSAEVISTVVQNNPKGQQNVLNAGGMTLLLQTFTSDPDLNVKIKSLGAISSLVRHNRQALDAFRLGTGFTSLKPALLSGDTKFTRKALNVLIYMMQESDVDRKAGIESGLAHILIDLISNDDIDVRQSSLRALAQMAVKGSPQASALVSVQGKTGSESGSGKANSLKNAMVSRMEAIKHMRGEDLESSIEERHLLVQLWKQCFSENSPLEFEPGVEVRDEDLESSTQENPTGLRISSEPLKLLGPPNQ